MLVETRGACGRFSMKMFTQNEPLTEVELSPS